MRTCIISQSQTYHLFDYSTRGLQQSNHKEDPKDVEYDIFRFIKSASHQLEIARAFSLDDLPRNNKHDFMSFMRKQDFQISVFFKEETS